MTVTIPKKYIPFLFILILGRVLDYLSTYIGIKLFNFEESTQFTRFVFESIGLEMGCIAITALGSLLLFLAVVLMAKISAKVPAKSRKRFETWNAVLLSLLSLANLVPFLSNIVQLLSSLHLYG